MNLALATSPASLLVPVMPAQRIPAWPRPNDERAPKVDYQTLAAALSSEHATDAHFTAYSVPLQPYRLNKNAPEKLKGGVQMVLAVFDIDGPGHAASDEWWGDQGENLARLDESVPGLFVYRTRGGYRIVGRLAAPFILRSTDDAKVWTDTYLAWCAWLWRCFEIKADPVGDWQRLYRLPIVKRDGKTVRYATLGTPNDVGVLQCAPSAADIETAKGLRRKPAADKRKGTAKTRPITTDYTGSGILVRVLQNRGDLGTEVSRGMWTIRCPRAAEHSSGSDFDTSTVVFAPTNQGDSLGWIDCKHTNCGHFDKTIKDWLKCFDQTELDRAREQLGIPVQQRQQPQNDYSDGYVHTDADEPRLPFEVHGTEAAPAEQPTAAEPLRGLKYLGKVALVGRNQILELAATPVDYVWQDIAVAGTVVLIAGPPAEGKTTLLFMILAARMNLGEVVPLLGRSIQPAPPGMFLVVIEGEHSEASTSRKFVKSLKLLKLDDSGLERLIIVARKAVRLGSPEWVDVTRMVAAGLVSDIALDTIARVAPADANDEREQVALFDAVAQTIEAAPEGAPKPLVWAVAHTRKNNANGDLADVSGSAQRTGQADTVLMIKGEKVDGRTVSTTVTFAKLREDPDDYPMPVTFSITDEGLELEDGGSDGKPDDRPVEDRILELLEKGPKTKNELQKLLKRNTATLEAGISKLFASGSIIWTEVVRRGRSWRALMTRSVTPD